MKKYEPNRLRNIALIGHGKAGKTPLPKPCFLTEVPRTAWGGSTMEPR